jgi:hypothetical protein
VNRILAMIVALVLGVCMALAVSSCGDDDDSTGATTATTAATPTQVETTAAPRPSRRQRGGAKTSFDISKPEEIDEFCKQVPDACMFYPNK